MVKYDTKLSDYDLFLELEAFSEGRSCHAWRCFGSHPGQKDGQDGYVFRVWAPNAKQVCVFGDFNGWDENAAPLEKLEGGIWQGFVPGLKRFDTYKYAMSKDLVYLQSGMLIPLYHQQDYPNSPYSQYTTVSKSGCGPTSMAMITSYMTGEAVYPDEIAGAYGKYYVKGKGSSHQLFYAVAKDYGYKCKSLDVNAQVIINERNKGHPVIVTVGKGDFTSQAHVMVIRGVTEDGFFLLNDSNVNNYKKYGTDKFEVQMVMQNIGTKGHAYSFSF